MLHFIVEDMPRGFSPVFACHVRHTQGGGMDQSVSATRAALSVLVVDDEPGIPEVVSAMLSSDGHTVATAADGARALMLARATPYQLVISDYMMPGMHGGELFTAMRQEMKHPFWFILMSVLSEREVRRFCPDCHAFLRKPFGPEGLSKAVEAGRKGLRPAAS